VIVTGHRVITIATAANSVSTELIAQLADRAIVLEVLSDAASALIAIGRSAPGLVAIPTDVVGFALGPLVETITRGGTPVVIAVAGDDANGDAVEGLDAGADALVGLPLSALELERCVRRLAKDHPEQLWAGDLVMDVAAHRVSIGDHEVHLSHREFLLLQRLLQNRGQLVGLAELESIAETDSPASLASVRVMIGRIRRKLGPGAGERLVATVRGVGYRIADETDAR
jgi:DNA-binding response OmpR family regulator